jgi:hypothetical protein
VYRNNGRVVVTCVAPRNNAVLQDIGMEVSGRRYTASHQMEFMPDAQSSPEDVDIMAMDPYR